MWFVTWDQPEYKEWAKKDNQGYQLVILRVESDGRLLCVKARLNIKAKGLPEFITEKERYYTSKREANKVISEWRAN